jgi:O-antigen/teichoic acid export membrane protein
MTIGSTILGLGAGVAVYSLAARREAPATALAQSLIVWAVAISIAVAVAAAGASAIGLLPAWIGSNTPLAIAVLAAGSGGQFLAMGYVQLATGLGRATSAAIGFGLPAVLVMVATVAAAIAAQPVTTYMLAQAAGWIGAAAVLAAILAVPVVPSTAAVRAIAARGRAAAVGDVANILSYRLDVLLLGLIAGSASVGVYSLAVQILEPIWIVATAASNGLLIRLRHLPRHAWIAATYESMPAVVGVTALAGGLAVVLVPVAIAVTGSSFAGAQVAAVALLPGIVALAVSKILAAYQVASGRLGLSSAVATTAVVCTTIGDLVLMPSLGALGAAIASSVGYGVSMVLWLATTPRHGRVGAVVE